MFQPPKAAPPAQPKAAPPPMPGQSMQRNESPAGQKHMFKPQGEVRKEPGKS